LSCFKNVVSVFLKESIDFFRSKALYFALVTPILLSLIFSVVFNGKDVKKPELLLVKNKNNKFYKVIEKSKIFNISYTENTDDAKNEIRQGKFQAAVSLSDELEKISVKSGEINIYVQSNSAQANMIEASIRELIRAYFGQKMPVKINKTEFGSKQDKMKKIFIPFWLLFTLLGGVSLAASSLVEEKDSKTIRALMVSPLKIMDVILGKASCVNILVAFSCFLILFLNKCFTGNIFLTVLIIIVASFLFTQLGILIGILCSGSAAANSVISIVYIAFILPVSMTDSSNIMNNISKYIPSYYVIESFNRSIFLNYQTREMIPYILVLLFWGILFVTLNYLTLKKNMEVL